MRSLGRALAAFGAAGFLMSGVCAPATAMAAVSAEPGHTAVIKQDTPCDSDQILGLMNACDAWKTTQGANTTVAVIGDPNGGGTEAQRAATALAPAADVQLVPTTGTQRGGGPTGTPATPSGGTPSSPAQQATQPVQAPVQEIESATRPGIGVIDVADGSVDLTDPGAASAIASAQAQGIIVVAAAGDAKTAIAHRPAGMVNVSATDDYGQPQPNSDFGPLIAVAAYGNDTSTASGYVAATLALVRSEHTDWTPIDAIAQVLGTAHSIGSDIAPPNQQIGYGVIHPLLAVSQPLQDPSTLPGFSALFPASTSGPPSLEAAGGDSASGTSTHPVAATTTPGSHGTSPLLLFGLVLIALAGAFFFWKRRQEPEAVTLKPREEWEPPQGPRHSGYGPPAE